MAFAHPHLRLSWGGTQAGGNEIWTNSIALGGNLDNTNHLLAFYDLGAYIDELGAAIQAFIGSTEARVPNDSKLLWVKLAPIGTDGKYVTFPIEDELNWGGNINAPYSPQDAWVVTLGAAKFKAPGKYNRFYVPTAGPAGTNAWRFNTAEQEGMAGVAVEFLEDIAQISVTHSLTYPVVPSVVSDVGAGSELPVVGVSIGAIVDTQRRRRNKLSEDYVTDAVVYP